METALVLAPLGLALGWPLEWVIQRFPLGEGTAPSRARALAVAALTALLFAALGLKIGPEPRLLPALLLTAAVVPASAIDLRHRIIPDLINLPAAPLVFLAAVAAQPDRWVELLLGGLGAFLFLGIAWAVYPAGLGLGDVKMALMMGLGLGRYVAPALFAALVISLVPSLAILARGGLAARKTGLPFGPFLAAGAVVGLLFGPELWAGYVGSASV
jgi:leader peptidase (prepilin peptidase)/N-methyltransferase